MVTGVPGPSSIRLPSQTGLQALVAPYGYSLPYEVRTGAVGGGVEAGERDTGGRPGRDSRSQVSHRSQGCWWCEAESRA